MKNFVILFFSCLMISGLYSCSSEHHETGNNSFLQPADSGIQTGGVKLVPVKTAKGNFNVWTKSIGNNPKMKLMILTGGPGASHEYAECFESFMPAEGIELIYYDQLATGFSDNPKDTALYDLARYVEEVETVRKALGLGKDNLYILGHSWGGILAMEYALKYQENIKGLIISNMMSSAIDYGNYADEVLAKQMDPKVLAEVRAIESKSDFSNPRYMELLMPHFYAQHICRIPLDRWPEPINRSFSKMNQDFYVMMQGPSEFGISGKLEKWDRKKDLPKLAVPTLTIGARHDSMDPEHMKWMATQVKNGSYLYCPEGSHMAFYDDQKTYFKGLISFIRQINDGEKKASL